MATFRRCSSGDFPWDKGEPVGFEFRDQGQGVLGIGAFGVYGDGHALSSAKFKAKV